MSKLGALILAGGHARRMGRDKAALVWRGRSLLDHACAIARDAGAEPVLISGRPGGLADPLPDPGPAGGVLALALRWRDAAGHLPARWLLLPVDMPGLEAGDLAPLCRDAKAPVVHFENSPLPAVLRLSPAVVEVLAEAIGNAGNAQTAAPAGERVLALHRLWARIGACVLPLPQEAKGRFVNINTPDDWREFLARHQ